MAASSLYSMESLSKTMRGWTYDVFLSFRGIDTRHHFLDHLYTDLDNRGISTFKDDLRLLTGEPIAGQLSEAIKESRFSVVVFSKNYAGSAWCLDELVHINDCRNIYRQTVIPVFYYVDPSVVRNQLASFGEAFEKHEQRYEDPRKVKRWKDALLEIANLSGFTADGNESICIKRIAQEISSKCIPISNYERNLVGINSRVQYLKLVLDTELDVVRFVGIWGIGGSGKTTLAQAVYNEISYQFEGKICFVSDVKERSKQYSGLEILQQKILSELLMDKSLEVKNIYEGTGLMKSRLQHKKVLLVLDDVDDDAQLDALAASHEWFGKGSRIIITTRDKRWLTRPTSIEMYNASLLNDTEAIKLFSLYAFGKGSPPEDYKDDSYNIVRQAGGFPLALKIFGASLYGSTMDEWKSALSRLEFETIEGEDEVSKMLKVSYDGLSKIDQKILLDITCFYKGKKQDRVTRILDSFDFHAHIGIKHLLQRSLISVSNNRIHMHDRIQEMGWNIVRKKSDKPGARSRVWLRDDVIHVLTKNTGTNEVEAISFRDSVGVEDFTFCSRSFENMKELRLLELSEAAVLAPNKHLHGMSLLDKRRKKRKRSHTDPKSTSLAELECLPNLRWLYWKGYNLDSFPESFGRVKLVGLEMRHSQIVQLWEEKEVPNRKSMDKLRFIDLTDSCKLQRAPDVRLTPNLQKLILAMCWNLVEVHPSIGDHQQLVYLSLEHCGNLQSLPPSIAMKSLETLILSDCCRLKTFPDIEGNMKKLLNLRLDGTSIKELPVSIGNLSGLVFMDVSGCRNLTSLPSTICELRCLKALYATSCSSLKKLPENLGLIQSLEDLRLYDTPIGKAPSSVVLLKNLKILYLRGCRHLMHSMLSDSSRLGLEQPLLLSFLSIRSLFIGNCNLENSDIPDLSPLSSLEELDLSCNYNLNYLPEGICQLPRLRVLDVSNCQHLQALETLPSGLAVLYAQYTAFTEFPDLSTKYNSLWKLDISYYGNPNVQSGSLILSCLLQGLLTANHRFSLRVPGHHIPEWFGEQNPDNLGCTQLPLKWYKEDILGFAISTVLPIVNFNDMRNIQFDLIEESNCQCVPHTSTRKACSCTSHKLWVGFISFAFFQLLFPEFDICNWSTFTGTIGFSIPNARFMCEKWAIRPMYNEDVECVPTIKKSAVVENDPMGQPWLKHYFNDEDKSKFSDVGQFDGREHCFRSNTAYIKDRGRTHARLCFNP